jgi:hypothetical protein
MVDLASTFARQTGCEREWREAMEGITIGVSPFQDEARQQGDLRTQRRNTVEVLETRFPGQVPTAVLERIYAETKLDTLMRWHRAAITLTLEAFQEQM